MIKKTPVPAKSQEAGERLLRVLKKMAVDFECESGSVLDVSPRVISEFLHGKSSVQRIVAVAKAHPEIVTYEAGYRKHDHGCLASREAAGYYEAQIKWVVQP